MRNGYRNLPLLLCFLLLSLSSFLASFVLLLFNTSLSCHQRLTGALWQQLLGAQLLLAKGKQRSSWNGSQELGTGQSKDQEMRTANQGSLHYVEPALLTSLIVPMLHSARTWG